MKKFGFTLAEVMITLGIIGVVAALTVPALVKNYQKTVYVTSLHKVYNEMDSAIKQYMTDQHVDDLRESDLYSDSNALKEFVNNYLKVTKDCGESYVGCFSSTYTTMNGEEYQPILGKCNNIVILAGGAALCSDVVIMEATKNENDEDVTSSNHIGTDGDVIAFEVDINGIQPPNIYGRDVFSFQVSQDGEIYDKFFKSYGNTMKTEISVGPDTGAFGQIINDGWKMNY